MNMFIHDQALALIEQGHKVGVLVPNYPHPNRVFKGKFDLREGLSSYEIDGVPVINFLFLPIPIFHNIITKFIVSKCFTRYTKLYGMPDIIHAQFLWYGGIIANILQDLTKVPYIITCHSSEFFKEKISNYKYSESKRVLKNARAIIAVSKFLGERISKVFNIENVQIVPNTINDDRFPACQPDANRNNTFVFTSVGSLLENKGFKNLLIAFNSIQNDRMILNIIGQGPQRAELENLAKDLSLSEKVIFHGLLTSDEVIRVLQSTNVVISASNLETFGMTIIESLSCGIPVLATNSGGPGEIINENNGILVCDNSPDQLAKGMVWIFENYSDFDPKIIRKECVQKYGKHSFAIKMEKIYCDILDSIHFRKNNY